MKKTFSVILALAWGITEARAASFMNGDATVSLGPDFFVDEAVLGGYDVTSNEPASFGLIRSFQGLNMGEQGATVEITGIAFAIPNAALANDATELEVTLTHLGPDDTYGTGDDVVLGTETIAFTFDGVGEYYAIFDLPMTGTLSGTVRRFRIEIAPRNLAGDGSLRLKAAALRFETSAGPKLTVAGTSTAVGNPIFFDVDNDGLADKVETGTGIFVDAANTGTNPLRRDTDNDGLGDGFEIGEGLDAHDNSGDWDADNFSDADEIFFYATDPKNVDEFPGDGENPGPLGLTAITEFGRVEGAALLPLPPNATNGVALGSALINEAMLGGNDLNYGAGLTDFTVVYANLFEGPGTPVSISGFAFPLVGVATESGDMMVEFYDPSAADDNPDFDGVDRETRVGSATGTLTVGETGIYYWAFDEPVMFASKGTGLAVRFLFSNAVRLKAQNATGSGVRYSNQGAGAFTENDSMKLTLFGMSGDGVILGGLVITDSGFEANGDFFIEVQGGVTGKIVTRSGDLESAFTAVATSNDGLNRFIIPATGLDPQGDGRDFFRVELAVEPN